VDLSSWQLESTLNSLQLVSENTINNVNIASCDVETSLYEGSLEWFLLYSEDVALFYEMSQTAVLDGYTRYMTNEVLTEANTVANIPFFWYNMSLTTTFGFIPYPNYTGCANPAINGGGGTKWEVYLSIPAVIIFIVIVLIVLMFILRPARCFKRRRSIPSYETKHPMVAVGSEMVILPPSSPPPAEVPPPVWQGDPHASTTSLVDHPYANHMSMQFPPPPNHTYRPAHASAPYGAAPPYHDAPAPSAPLPSPDGNKNYINDEHHE